MRFTVSQARPLHAPFASAAHCPNSLYPHLHPPTRTLGPSVAPTPPKHGTKNGRISAPRLPTRPANRQTRHASSLCQKPLLHATPRSVLNRWRNRRLLACRARSGVLDTQVPIGPGPGLSVSSAIMRSPHQANDAPASSDMHMRGPQPRIDCTLYRQQTACRHSGKHANSRRRAGAETRMRQSHAFRLPSSATMIATAW